MSALPRVELDWRALKTSPSDPGSAIVPILSIRLDDAGAFGIYATVLCPAARVAILPAPAAAEVGIDPATLPRVSDPLFPGFDLRFWQRSAPLRVFGRGFAAHLLVRQPVAFDASGLLPWAVLGERFFQQVRVHLEPDKEDASWIEQCRALD